jgi:hypothetical protein
VYYNGWQAPDRAHGHGIYTQNATGTRLIAENLLFHQFSHGVHAYGSEVAALDNITLEGNISFMNGSISRGGIYESGRDLLLGGSRLARNPVMAGNATYGGQTNLGYGGGCSNGRVTSNYFAGPLLLINCTPAMTGNTVWDKTWPRYGTWPTQYPQNTFHTTTPTGTIVRVRPNKYETGRAHIAVYNWGRASVVPVNISASKLPVGAAYEIRDAQNYFGRPVVTGTYDGRPVNLVMSGLSAAAAVGNVPSAAKHTAPEFAAFVVVPKASLPSTPTEPDAPADPTTPTAPAPTITLSLSSAAITAGQSATLSWSSTDAATVSIEPGIGTVSARGTVTVSPRATTTYTATATNAAGETARSQATLTVNTSTETDTPPKTETPESPEPAPTTPTAPTAVTVQMSAPANNTLVLNQSTVTLTADVSDPAGLVTKVEFYRGAAIIGTAWKKPYSFNWSYVSSGTYAITARAYDRSGVVATSAPITVRSTNAPAVTLTSPRAGSYSTPATLTLTANATDQDGRIARVEYYRGSTLVGRATAAPYTFTWAAVPEGTHVLTARAIDNLGMAKTSAPVSIAVYQAPAVQLIAPNPAGTYLNQGTIALEAAASARDSRVTKVEFYRNGAIIGTSTVSPYRWNWTFVSTGTYVITAKAYTDKGLTGLSAPVTISVK